MTDFKVGDTVWYFNCREYRIKKSIIDAIDPAEDETGVYLFAILKDGVAPKIRDCYASYELADIKCTRRINAELDSKIKLIKEILHDLENKKDKFNLIGDVK